LSEIQAGAEAATFCSKEQHAAEQDGSSVEDDRCPCGPESDGSAAFSSGLCILTPVKTLELPTVQSLREIPVSERLYQLNADPPVPPPRIASA